MMCAAATAFSADYIFFHRGTSQLGIAASEVESITLSNDGTEIELNTTDGLTHSLTRTDISSLTPQVNLTDAPQVEITFNGDEATVVNPYAFAGIDIAVDGANVTITADSEGREVVYHVSGATTNGSLKVYSNYKLEILLDNAQITNPIGAAINIQSGKKTTLRVPAGTESTLCDGATYTNTPDGEDEKGTLFSEGQIEFRGKGTLNVTGKKKHAIVSDDYVELKNTTVNVLSAASDGIHVNDYFTMESGSLTMTNLGGDGIDADDNGYINISGGTINISVDSDTRKGLKSGDADITISGGDITIVTSGAVEVTDGDPSYCTAIKAKANLTVTDGNIKITSTGTAGKGLSVDGNAQLQGGTFDITVSGAGGTYTNASSTTDSYSSTCITVDGDLTLTGGTYTLTTGSAASGGKCIKVDGAATFGTEGGTADDFTITATTNGARFSVGSSSSTPGGNNNWGNRNAPGGNMGGGNMGGGNNGGGNNGGDSDGDYSNPKVVKVTGNIVINSGSMNLTATTQQEGGEGLESKTAITINGGTIEISTYDDCINAASSSGDLIINGGQIFCTASGNDGIDSNNTIHINGGTIVTLGTTSPDCGIDCDGSSNFTLTGGTIVAIGGDNDTPSGSGTTQRVVTYSASVKTTTTYTLVDSSGNLLLSFCSPRAYSSSAQMMFSAPELTSTGKSVTIYTGATLSGGTTFHGLTSGGTYSGGTKLTTATTK
jgi:hypothetical protein